jgi:hypothetical protein
MWFFWCAGALIAGLVGGYFLGWRVATISMQPGVQELLRDSAVDRAFVLSVLRRELANWMLRRDPDRYRGIYKNMHDAVAAIRAANRSDQEAQLATLTKEYPFYHDFDLLRLRIVCGRAEQIQGVR